MPASVNWPMSAGMPYSSSNAYRQLRAPAPPVEIRVPSMSKRTAWGSLMRARLTGGTACAAVRVALGPVAGRPAVALGGDQVRPGGRVRLDRFGDLLALGLVLASSSRSALRHTPSRQPLTISSPATSSSGFQLALVMLTTGS